jgi:hypothetical protein
MMADAALSAIPMIRNKHQQLIFTCIISLMAFPSSLSCRAAEN